MVAENTAGAPSRAIRRGGGETFSIPLEAIVTPDGNNKRVPPTARVLGNL